MIGKNLIKKSLFKKWWFWTLVVLGLFMIIGLLSSDIPTAPLDTPTAPADIPTEQVIESRFDVPNLIDKTIDQIRKQLGQPADDAVDPNQQQLALGTQTWSNVWHEDEYILLVTFNPNNRQVIEFFINAITQSEMADPTLLYPIGNIISGSHSYSIEPVRMLKNPKLYTGIRITPR